MEVVQLYYGILILFVIRLTIKAIFNFTRDSIWPNPDQTAQDSEFYRGLVSPLYHPMLHALVASKMSFARSIQLMDAEPSIRHDDDLRMQCEEAATLLPLSKEAKIFEHVNYFFEQMYESPDLNSQDFIQQRRSTTLASQSSYEEESQ